MKRRLVIITELIAPYRIPVFNALAKRSEVDLHVIFLSRTDGSMRQWRVYEDEIGFSYQVLPSWRRRIGKFNVLLNRGIVTTLSKLGPDVVICGGYNYLASWQAMRWAKRRRVPFLLWSESTVDDLRNQRAIPEILKRRFINNCDAFVVPGISARKYLLNFGVPSAKIFLARNAVDTALFSAQVAVAGTITQNVRARFALPQRYFLYVGRLVHSKGVLDLLDAYAQLAPELRSEVGLVFAGDGPIRPELEARAREIHPGCVHFSGFVHREDLGSYYALAECFVFPTKTDPWGLVVNEAMACHLPVICTRVAGCAADLVKENGRLVSPGDAAELAAAMAEIAGNPALRNRMASESATLIQNYSPEICAAGFAEASSALEAHVG